ncbi:hypothetical protein LEMLEM_LOCUS20759, partial [Lemmus lemmus]
MRPCLKRKTGRGEGLREETQLRESTQSEELWGVRARVTVRSYEGVTSFRLPTGTSSGCPQVQVQAVHRYKFRLSTGASSGCPQVQVQAVHRCKFRLSTGASSGCPQVQVQAAHRCKLRLSI